MPLLRLNFSFLPMAMFAMYLSAAAAADADPPAECATLTDATATSIQDGNKDWLHKSHAILFDYLAE